jgi:parallel beta-helix repeat protein
MFHFSRRVAATVLGALSLLALARLPVATAEAASAPRYYVAINGHDSNRGTEAQPFRTLRKGVSVLTPGATLYVKGGTYSEDMIDTIPGGRSWSQPVTIAAYPGHEVVVKPPRGSKYVLRFRGAHQAYIILSGLTIDASNVRYEAVRITSGGTPATAAHHIRLIESEIKNSPINGIVTADFAHSNEFIRLFVHHHGDINGDGTRTGTGFYLASNNNLVEQCVIQDAGYGVLVSKPGVLAHGNVIRNNAITRNRFGGLLRRGSQNLFYNNLVFQNGAMGLMIDDAADRAEVFNNTMYRNGGYGIYIGSGSTGAKVVNNIVYANAPDIRNVGRSTTLGHNITVDPKFFDAERLDFRLRNGSPAIDGGVRLALVTRDALGSSRPQGLTHDVGAFEMTPASPPAPKPAPAPQVAPTPVSASAPTPDLAPAPTPTSAPKPAPMPDPASTPTPAPVPKADVVPSSLKLGSVAVKAGGTTSLQLAVANGGTATARSVVVTIALVAGVTTSKAASINVGTLSAGTSGMVATTLRAPMLAGTYTVLATAATPDPETSTANNATATTLSVASAPIQAASCDYYASPAGAGRGTSASDPFRVRDFWAVAAPGKTLCLLDGTYRGADSMITPALDKNGTSSQPIMVKALNDGGVTIDGEFARHPVSVSGDYWILEGFNAKNGSTKVVDIRGNNNIVRRVVAWDTVFSDANGNSGAVFSCQSVGFNNLFEDVAGFGIAASIFSASQNHSDGHCTFRRAWGRLDGGGDHDNWSSVFGGALYYNAKRSTCENCIEELRPDTGLTSYRITNPRGDSNSACPGGVCTDGLPPLYGHRNSRWDYEDTQDGDGQMLGSLFYARAGANIGRILLDAAGSSKCTMPSGCAMLWSGSANVRINSVTYKDVLYFFDPNHTKFSRTRGLLMAPHNTTLALTLDRISTVAGNANVINEQWRRNSVVSASSLSGLNAANANPWTGTAGANLCYRYVNRAKTTTPLWPWPMNERIKAATAASGAYRGPCPNCLGSFPTRTAVDVTADVEQMLGTIPDSCRQ